MPVYKSPVVRKPLAIVGFSGGVTSAWCAGWAIRKYGKENVVLLFHDTKEEDTDTYRFLREMAAALDMEITERSDGRSVTDLAYDMNTLPNDRMPFCSRVLKIEPGNEYMRELVANRTDRIAIKVVGFSANEPDRVQRATALSWSLGYTVRFPLIEEKVTKQQAAEWCQVTMGVRIPDMYQWSDHANCVGCARGGIGYWLAVKENRPDVFEQRKQLEAEFGHTFNKKSLVQIETGGLKRKVNRKESINIGPCDCGD